MLVGLIPPPLCIRGRLKLTTDSPLSLHEHLPDAVAHREGAHKNLWFGKQKREARARNAISAD